MSENASPKIETVFNFDSVKESVKLNYAFTDTVEKIRKESGYDRVVVAVVAEKEGQYTDVLRIDQSGLGETLKNEATVSRINKNEYTETKGYNELSNELSAHVSSLLDKFKQNN